MTDSWWETWSQEQLSAFKVVIRYDPVLYQRLDTFDHRSGFDSELFMNKHGYFWDGNHWIRDHALGRSYPNYNPDGSDCIWRLRH